MGIILYLQSALSRIRVCEGIEMWHLGFSVNFGFSVLLKNAVNTVFSVLEVLG